MIRAFLDWIPLCDMAGVRTFLVCVCLYGSSSFYDGCTYIPVCEVSSFCKFSFIILVFLEIFLFVSVYFSVFVCFWVRFSLRSPGCPQIYSYLSASTSQMLQLQTLATMLGDIFPLIPCPKCPLSCLERMSDLNMQFSLSFETMLML